MNQTNTDCIPGQMSFVSYMDSIGMQDPYVEKQRKHSICELYCFEQTAMIRVPREENDLRILEEHENMLTILRESGYAGEPDTVTTVSKYKYSYEKNVKFFVLHDRMSGYEMCVYCIGGRFADVDAVNALMKRLGGVPGRIVITHMTKNFDSAVIRNALKYYGVKVVSEPDKAPEMAKSIRKFSKGITGDELSITVRETEDKFNFRANKAGEIPNDLWVIQKRYFKKLPEKPYRLVERKKLAPMFNYHVNVNNHFYSVPHEVCDYYRETKQRLCITITKEFVEIGNDSGVIFCVHNNDEEAPYPYTTDVTHMPDPRTIPYDNRNGYRFGLWAGHVGASTSVMCKFFLRRGCCEMQGYVPCMGLITLERRFSAEILEMACKKELEFARDTRCFPELSRIRSRCMEFAS